MAPNVKKLKKLERLWNAESFKKAEEKRAKKENEKMQKRTRLKKKDARIRELQDKKLKKTIT